MHPCYLHVTGKCFHLALSYNGSTVDYHLIIKDYVGNVTVTVYEASQDTKTKIFENQFYVNLVGEIAFQLPIPLKTHLLEITYLNTGEKDLLVIWSTGAELKYTVVTERLQEVKTRKILKAQSIEEAIAEKVFKETLREVLNEIR